MYETIRSDIYQSDYIEHFGIKGMKWGVWNEETRARRQGHREARRANREAKKARKDAYKNVRSLSDEDIAKGIKRIENEKRYKEMIREDLHPGREATKKALLRFGGTVAAAASVAVITGVVQYELMKHAQKVDPAILKEGRAMLPDSTALLGASRAFTQKMQQK